MGKSKNVKVKVKLGKSKKWKKKTELGLMRRPQMGTGVPGAGGARWALTGSSHSPTSEL